MTFKQSLLIAFLPLLVACSSDSVTDDSYDNTIRFAATEVITRAETEPISPNFHIYISALWHTSQTTQFENTLIKELTRPDNNVSSWGTGWYWPPAGNMNFMAWGANSTINDSWVKFTYTDKESIPSAKPETTFASLSINLAGKMNGTHDIIYLNKLDKAECDNQRTPRKLVFDHATSSLSIALRAKDTLTARNLGILGARLDSVPVSGLLTVNVDEPKSDPDVISNTTPAWSNIQHTDGVTLTTFSAPDDDHPLLLPMPKSNPDVLQQDTQLYVIPGNPDAKLTLRYSISGSVHSFVLPFAKLKDNDGKPEKWAHGKHYLYRLAVSLKEIEGGAQEEQWDTEIGGNAFEPEWSVEIRTGAMESTWAVEIDGQAYEMTWSVEIGVSALESVWVSEIQAGASENGWNSEMGSSAGENEWNSETGASAEENEWNTETGGTAAEEKWNEETSGTAWEAPWTRGDDIIIGGEPEPSSE